LEIRTVVHDLRGKPDVPGETPTWTIWFKVHERYGTYG